MTTKSKKRYGENFERSFNIGDLVRVAGYDDDVFQIEGYVYSEYYFIDEEWTELVYELARITDGQWVDAEEEDMSLVAPADQAEDYLRKMERKSRQKRVEGSKIDDLLTKLNDYKVLYEHFGDDEYKTEIERIKTKLRRTTRKE